MKPKCEICEQIFSSEINLERHVNIEHNEAKIYQCHVCKKACKHNGNLKKHIALVHENESSIISKDFMCEFCEIVFKTKDRLNFHVRNEHKQVDKKCDICDKEFANTAALKCA